jgi:glycine cleavage system H protein
MQEYLELMIDKFVFRVATDRLYSVDGVWVQREADKVRIGLSDFVQQRGGDLAFIHVKPAGTKLAEGEELAEVETIKVNQGVFAPLDGTIVETNADLDLRPEIINQDPYGRGWLAILEADDWEASRAMLLGPDAYRDLMQSQAEEENA